MNNKQPDADELRAFIEFWIPIHVKDAQYVKEARTCA